MKIVILRGPYGRGRHTFRPFDRDKRVIWSPVMPPRPAKNHKTSATPSKNRPRNCKIPEFAKMSQNWPFSGVYIGILANFSKISKITQKSKLGGFMRFLSVFGWFYDFLEIFEKFRFLAILGR